VGVGFGRVVGIIAGAAPRS